MFTTTSPCRRRLVQGARRLIVLAVLASASVHAVPPADVALAVVYDTSGSMKSPIRAQDGRYVAKHVIAKRAFGLVIDRLERFTQPAAGQPAKNLDLGIVIFDGVRTRTALPVGPFKADVTRAWLAALPVPDSGTPLGDAMLAAGRALQASPAASKHLLVLTDGENTSGSTPVAALAALQKQTLGQDQPVFVHVLALDISPAVFVPLQKAGATLIGASDEKQLQSQLDFILENQILVEAP